MLVVTAMQSLMYPPTGFLQRLIASLYARTCSAICAGVPNVKHSEPSPSSPASTNVLGLEQATHIGGCGLVNGFGSTCRFGMRKYLPSYSYCSSPHMRGICSSVSRHIGLVSARLGISKPPHSAEDEPRPVPNST